MKRILSTLAIIGLLAFAGCGAPLETDDGIVRSTIALAHNKERGSRDITQLKYSKVLEEKAQKWAEEMARMDSMVHSDVRAAVQGSGFRGIGENIAYGYTSGGTDQPSIDKVMEGWMNSPGHKKNILRPEYTHIGIGYARRVGGYPYWCAQFGIE